MIDINQPWAWANTPQQNTPLRKPLGNTLESLPQVAPAGADIIPAGPLSAAPRLEEKVIGNLVEGVGKTAVDSVVKGLKAPPNAADYAKAITTEGTGTVASGAGSQAAMLAEQTASFGSEGLAATADAAKAGAAGAGAAGAGSFVGPLGAAASGLMKGEYDEAAGAAIGSAVGSMYLGPIGAYIGGKLGGYAGNAVGSVFGFQDGTTAVPASGGKGVMNRIRENAPVSTPQQPTIFQQGTLSTTYQDNPFSNAMAANTPTGKGVSTGAVSSAPTGFAGSQAVRDKMAADKFEFRKKRAPIDWA